MQSAEHATFKAVYTYTSPGSATPMSVTIEQEPPKSLFSASGGLVINNGTTTYYCSTSGATDSCFTAGTGSNPLASIATVFSPTSAITAMQTAESEVAAHLQGYNVSFSSASFAGQSSTCVTVSSQAQTGKYCVTKGGILAYSGANGSNFSLTSYSSSVSASDFSLPAGAQTVTIPGGVG